MGGTWGIRDKKFKLANYSRPLLFASYCAPLHHILVGVTTRNAVLCSNCDVELRLTAEAAALFGPVVGVRYIYVLNWQGLNASMSVNPIPF
jgi:hypothetical protein